MYHPTLHPLKFSWTAIQEVAPPPSSSSAAAEEGAGAEGVNLDVSGAASSSTFDHTRAQRSSASEAATANNKTQLVETKEAQESRLVVSSKERREYTNLGTRPTAHPSRSMEATQRKLIVHVCVCIHFFLAGAGIVYGSYSSPSCWTS